MKRLLLALFMAPVILFAQSNGEGSILNKDQSSISQEQVQMNFAGEHIEKAGNGLINSGVLMLVGATCLWYGSEADSKLLQYGGGVAIGFGFFLQLRAFDDIRIAGQSMRKY